MFRSAHLVASVLTLTLAGGCPGGASSQDAIPFSAYEWTNGTGSLSEYHFRTGTDSVSAYWLTRTVEPGSFHHLMNGTDVLSAYWWLNATEPGSAYFWRNGTGVGSEYWWRNGTGCLSEYGWRVGTTCDDLATRFVVTLCIVRAIRIEPCAAIEGTLPDWLSRQDEWYVGGDGATRRIEEMRAAVAR